MIDFDIKAKDWDSNPRKIERARIIAEGIRRFINLSPVMNALEYGCGTGLLSFALQPYLNHITLADSSPKMISVLKGKIDFSGVSNMTPVKLDLPTDPLPSDRYHLIYTLMTLHHIPDTEKILSDFCALLKRKGFLCVADLDKEDGSFHGPDFSGHKGFDRDELKEKLVKVGFRNISFTSCYKMTKEVDAGLRTFPLFLMAAEKG